MTKLEGENFVKTPKTDILRKTHLKFCKTNFPCHFFIFQHRDFKFSIEIYVINVYKIDPVFFFNSLIESFFMAY